MNQINEARILAAALHQVLAGSGAVQSALGNPPRLYDDAPEDPVFPYLTYGSARSEDESADDAPMTAHILTLHLWSRYAGRAEVFDLLHIISSALHGADLSSAQQNVCALNVNYTDVFRTADRRTLHGVLRLSVKTQPTDLPYEEAV